MLLPANLHRPLLLLTLLTPALTGQWYSLPKNPAQPVTAGNWCLSHDTGNGIAVFSAIGQQWLTISPAGSTILKTGDAVVVTQESPTQLRAWSAYSNTSATQTVSSNFQYFNLNNGGLAHAVIFDPVLATNGVLRGYSAYTNTWASVPVATPSTTFSVASAENVAIYHDGLDYHAWSAYTGQWTTFTVPVAAGNALLGPDFAAIDLQGTGGPRQYAAFSALRGTWSLSPIYPSAGAGLVYTPNANAFVVKVDTGIATTIQYAGYSPITGQWSTSSLVHTTASSQSTVIFGNVVRVQDTDVNARYEMFGAVNGIWQQMTGAGLSEDSVHNDFHVVKSSTLTSETLYVASALVGGGYNSLTVQAPFLGVSQGAHGCMISGDNAERGYSAVTNTFTGPVPAPIASGGSFLAGTYVWGFTILGSSATGTNAQAFSARRGTWVAGPAISPSQSWVMTGGGGMLVLTQNLGTSYSLRLFNEHQNRWEPPVSYTTAPQANGINCFLYSDVPGTWHAFSQQRSVWSTQTGIGAGSFQFSNVLDNLAWMVDANNTIWVFAAPDRTQSWFQWPYSAQYATSGTTPGGTTPYVGVSMRGQPNTFALLYAALDVPAQPIVIPGIGGQLDLSPASLVPLGGLGVFDSSGVITEKFAFGNLVPPGTQLWMQLVTVTSTLQIDIPGRSTGTMFF